MPDTRKRAVQSLVLILKGPGKPKDVLEMTAQSLPGRERGFLMEMVYGVLRQRDMLDMMLGWLMKKPSGVPSFTLNNLRAAMYQIFFMRVPGHAAVNEAVNLESRHRGLVNGVLRNAIREREAFLGRIKRMKSDISSGSPDASLSAMASLTSHPLWLVKRWAARMGTEEALSLALANNSVPPMTLRVNTLRSGRDELMVRLRSSGHGCAPTAYSPHGIAMDGPVPFDSLGLRGEALVQDEAAQMVSLMLSPPPGSRVLDACAAPGGKTAHLAALMADEGEIVALDADAPRLGRLRENIEAIGARSVSIMQADLREFEDPGGFDCIMLDAPCSALGVIRRNPDIKYRRRQGDLKRFSGTQSRMLRAASALLRPGGRLVYAVCSTEPEEGEQVVERFLKSSADFYIISKGLAVPGDLIGEQGYMRTWPHRHGIDGFFAALIGRKV